MKDRIWKIIYQALPEAQRQALVADDFFGLAQDVFRANERLNAEESRVRDIVANLINRLLTHGHVEKMDLPIVDFGVLGMSRLLMCCVVSLRSFKKPLDLRYVLHRRGLHCSS